MKFRNNNTLANGTAIANIHAHYWDKFFEPRNNDKTQHCRNAIDN